jgi:predicted GNAT family acetyltransferase
VNFGFNSPAVDYYIQESDGAISAVLTRYRTNLIPYTRDLSGDLGPMTAAVNACLRPVGGWMVSGKKQILDRIQPRLSLPPRNALDMFLCVCRKVQPRVPLDRLPMVVRASASDAAEIYALIQSIREFAGGSMGVETLAEEIASGKTRVAIIRDAESGRLVSCASVVAETDTAAMVILVGTDERHRRKGYASACVYYLVHDLERRGKSACLFFHNPEAGAIYHRLGFVNIGMWKMLKFGGR